MQFEERRIWIGLESFAACLVAFERLYSLGFAKESILSGRYHHGQMLKVGLALWREAEAVWAPWRRRPHLAELAQFVAQRQEIEMPEKEMPREEVEPCSTGSTRPIASQPRLL